jgi:hypothetical protein
VLLAPFALAQDEPGQDDTARPAVKLVRDLTRLPPGKYEMVQSYDQKTSVKLQRPHAGGDQESESRLSNTFTFDVEVAPASAEHPKSVAVTVRRVQIRVEGAEDHEYDSDGPPDDQSGIIRTQFRHLVRRTARVELAEFGKGKGFTGLDAAWADYLKENPDRERGAEINRKNYGDGRLDRMFLQGLDILFGAEAGRAHGRERELKAGQEFEVTLEEPGIGFEPTPLAHACKVESVRGGQVVIAVTWKENGLRPRATEGGGVIVRGGDMKCATTLTFRLDCGLLVGLEERIERTDQVSNGVDTRTEHRVETRKFTFRPK